MSARRELAASQVIGGVRVAAEGPKNFVCGFGALWWAHLLTMEPHGIYWTAYVTGLDLRKHKCTHENKNVNQCMNSAPAATLVIMFSLKGLVAGMYLKK